ncbi:uncharacterized protein [Lolium perenne]|uniref:uncharacterized protein isoform X1 n=1 Tax=Lolium perenne TaxID=4522 RepID=UPI003A9A33BF
MKRAFANLLLIFIVVGMLSQLTLFQFFLQFLGDSTYRWEIFLHREVILGHVYGIGDGRSGHVVAISEEDAGQGCAEPDCQTWRYWRYCRCNSNCSMYITKGEINVHTPFGNMKLSTNKMGGFTCLKKDDGHNMGILK